MKANNSYITFTILLYSMFMFAYPNSVQASNVGNNEPYDTLPASVFPPISTFENVDSNRLTFCQTAYDDYTPLVREGSEWCYYASRQYNYAKAYKYRIEGDTVVNNIAYKKMLRIGHHEIDDENGNYLDNPYMTTVHCLLREDNKRVYAKLVDTSFDPYINKISGELYDKETKESFLYDFNDLEEFYKYWLEYFGDNYDKQLVYESTDSCLLVNRKVYEIRRPINHKFIEGIGAYYTRDGDVVNHVWRVLSTARGHNLVYMKNSKGEYEYFNKDLYYRMLKAQHDVNEDGIVDVTDLNIVINDVLGLEQKASSHLSYIYGSITEDNDFDVADINSVINYILGLVKNPLDKTPRLQ